jgi:hypothetical protein
MVVRKIKKNEMHQHRHQIMRAGDGHGNYDVWLLFGNNVKV